ncbi:hypothetical protein VPH35_012104 [Triticum aestivum]|uniref:Uncharacterized protein n=1 Tax=Aegilops tauschii subsp. strangulata TaxID=200361 RepID=A0A452XHM5_AEGTS
MYVCMVVTKTGRLVERFVAIVSKWRGYMYVCVGSCILFVLGCVLEVGRVSCATEAQVMCRLIYSQIGRHMGSIGPTYNFWTPGRPFYKWEPSDMRIRRPRSQYHGST